MIDNCQDLNNPAAEAAGTLILCCGTVEVSALLHRIPAGHIEKDAPICRCPNE